MPLGETQLHAHLDKRSSQLIARTNRIGINFLLAELNAGLTFLQIAPSTDSANGRGRQFDKALKVYFTVVRLLPRVVLTSREEAEIQDKLGELKRQLEGAGYSCETRSNENAIGSQPASY